MSQNQITSDFLVIGAGIIGLTIARELREKFPGRSITILEKENSLGLHASGRNSGVLHSGIYYPSESYKAKFSAQGQAALASFFTEHNLSFRRIGKILLPTRAEDKGQLDLLYSRGLQNGVRVERLNEAELRKLEPEARSSTGTGLFVAATSVGNPKQVLDKMASLLADQGVAIVKGIRIRNVDPIQKQVESDSVIFSYGMLINTAGLHADSIAHKFSVGKDYTLLPFKGIYWKLDPNSGIKFNHLIYPVPDIRVPFLGVHTTTNTEGETYFGPTAVPAFGRENYRGISGIKLLELGKILKLIGIQLITDRDGFRRLAWQEGRRYFKPWFVQAAKAIVPRVEPQHLIPSHKVGIRAQMFHLPSGRLANDFVVEKGPDSVHILNSISPAWTCSIPFAKMVVEQYIQ